MLPYLVIDYLFVHIVVVEDDPEIGPHPQVSRRHVSPMENGVQDLTSMKQSMSSSGSVNVGKICLLTGPSSLCEMGSARLAPDSIYVKFGVMKRSVRTRWMR